MIGNGFMSDNAKIDKGVVPENEDLPLHPGTTCPYNTGKNHEL
jgi:hypothetical protein